MWFIFLFIFVDGDAAVYRLGDPFDSLAECAAGAKSIVEKVREAGKGGEHPAKLFCGVEAAEVVKEGAK